MPLDRSVARIAMEARIMEAMIFLLHRADAAGYIFSWSITRMSALERESFRAAKMLACPAPTMIKSATQNNMILLLITLIGVRLVPDELLRLRH